MKGGKSIFGVVLLSCAVLASAMSVEDQRNFLSRASQIFEKNAETCSFVTCSGPVFVRFSKPFCTGSWEAVEMFSLNEVLANCYERGGFYSSSQYTCSREPEKGLVEKYWTSSKCGVPKRSTNDLIDSSMMNNLLEQVPAALENTWRTYTCFNSFNDSNPITNAPAFSYAYLCDVLDLQKDSIVKSTLGGGLDANGPLAEEPWHECSKPGCAPNTPRLDYHATAGCNDAPHKSLALYSNLYNLQPNTEMCYFVPPGIAAARTPAIQTSFSSSVFCDSSSKTLNVRVSSEPCPNAAKKEFIRDRRYPLDQCLYLATTGEYIKYSCN